MTGILVFCRNCGKQVASDEMRDGLSRFRSGDRPEPPAGAP